MSDNQISGRQILLMQEAGRRRVFIDCCLGMRPGLEAAFGDAAKDCQQIANALGLEPLDIPSQITPDAARS